MLLYHVSRPQPASAQPDTCHLLDLPRWENFTLSLNVSNVSVAAPLPAIFFNETCKYWDKKQLKWSARGCETVAITPTEIVCECYHLTYIRIPHPVCGYLKSIPSLLLTRK